ncbi:ead/Ea22-like family protein [Cronobacter sakazakii]|nr:ead/Ea22-like family protein [Cronobacter sakazakii]
MNTAKLKAAALAAGGEEWAPRDQTKNCGEYTVIVKGSLEKHSGWTSCRPVADEVVNKQTMKFIALANPAAVLELIAALEAAQKRNAELTDALKQAVSGYKSCLRTGHDRIIELGGACDEPEVMIAGNPDIRQAEKILAGGE